MQALAFDAGVYTRIGAPGRVPMTKRCCRIEGGMPAWVSTASAGLTVSIDASRAHAPPESASPPRASATAASLSKARPARVSS